MLLRNRRRTMLPPTRVSNGRRRIAAFAVAVGLGWAGFSAGVVDAQDPGPPPVQQDAEKERLIQEIKELRKRMGGGVTESLKGLDLESPLAKPRNNEAAGDPFDPESTFQAAVRQLVDESVPPEYSRRVDPSQAPRPMGGGAGGQAEGTGIPFGPLQVPPQRPAGTLRGSGIAGGAGGGARGAAQVSRGPLEPWQALLASAQLLDQAANELESAGEFEIALEIRAQSSRVRARARQIYENGTPAADGQRPAGPPPGESAPRGDSGAGVGQPGGEE